MRMITYPFPNHLKAQSGLEERNKNVSRFLQSIPNVAAWSLIEFFA
jgi:hypothetical protein